MASADDVWDTSPDDAHLLNLLGDRLLLRKARLFAVGYCHAHRSRVLVADPDRYFRILEDVADGTADEKRYSAVPTRTGDGAELLRDAQITDWTPSYGTKAAYLRGRLVQLDRSWAVTRASAAAGPAPRGEVSRDHPWHAAFQAAYYAATHPKADLIRCVFPNPARPVGFPLKWRTSPVLALARGMYETRDFSPMPILADALQEAGCEHPDTLTHCRTAAPHVRGCWVVDAVLGKA